MNNDKLENIEIMIAHQEQQISELNDVITDQWTQIELLKRRLSKVLSKIDRLESGNNSGDDNLSSLEKAALERPPHY